MVQCHSTVCAKTIPCTIYNTIISLQSIPTHCSSLRGSVYSNSTKGTTVSYTLVAIRQLSGTYNAYYWIVLDSFPGHMLVVNLWYILKDSHLLSTRVKKM